MNLKSLSVLVLLNTFCTAYTQELVIRADYPKEKISNKNFALLPILDSIKEKQPINLRKFIYENLPSALSAVSDNHFIFINYDYRDSCKPKKYLGGRWDTEETTIVYVPQPDHEMGVPKDSADYIIILYGIDFQNKPPKGKLYINCIIWDNLHERMFANGRFKIESDISSYFLPREIAQDFIKQFAAVLVKNNTLEQEPKSMDRVSVKPVFNSLNLSAMDIANPSISFSNVFGLSGDHFSFGVGIGYDFFRTRIDGKRRSVFTLPIFISSKIRPIPDRSSVFILTEVGYTIQNIKKYQSNGGGVFTGGFGFGNSIEFGLALKHYIINLNNRSDKSETMLQLRLGFIVN